MTPPSQHTHTHSFLFTSSLFLANLFLIHYWDLFFLPWVSRWREEKGSFEFLMLHMKNVALVISQQYELVNFFCRTQHPKSGDDGRQWEDGGGEEESSGERSNVIRFRAHLEWFECQRLFVDDSSVSILWGVCYSPEKPVRTYLTLPPKHPLPLQPRYSASLTGL